MQTSTRWAVNSRFDSLFLLASLLTPFLFFGVYKALAPWMSQNITVAPELVFFALFTGLFDAPHIFQTFFRTHGGVEYKRRPWFHNLSLLSALVLTLGCYGLGLSDFFMTFLGFFGGWHILRQNLGFLKVYQSKEKERAQTLHGSEQKFLYFTWIYFLLREVNSQQEWFSSAWIEAPLFGWFITFLTLAWWVTFIMLLVQNLVGKNSQQCWPKMFFFFGQCLTFFILAQLNTPFLIMIALATIAHTIQYHGWIRHWGRSQSTWGLRFYILYYATWGLGLLLFIETLGHSFWTVGVVSLAVLYNGFVLWHYFIDGFVWSFRKQPELSQMISS